MTTERTVIHAPGQETEIAQVQGGPPDGGPSPLLRQAAEFAKVARESLEDCQRGAEAEQELAKRRNRSGQ